MSFSNQTISILRRCSGRNNPVIVNVANRLGQEYSIEGFIQKGYTFKNGVRTATKSVTEDYFILYFGDGKHSNIKLFAPSNYYALNVKSITSLDHVPLFENENYRVQLAEIKDSVEYKYGDRDYFTTSSPHQNVISSLLGKTVIYKGNEFQEIYNQECLVTYAGHTDDLNTIRLQLRYGTLKKDIVVNIKDLRKTVLVLPSIFTNTNEY